MAVFFPDLLDGFLNPAFLKKTRDKFHYGETGLTEFQEVAREMLPLIRKEAFWESKESSVFMSGNYSMNDAYQSELSDVSYVDVVMSLGEGLDSLQENYSRQGMLSKSYMLEVLAGELLMQGYSAYNRFIETNTKQHVAKYHFLGSESFFPLEMLPHLLQRVTDKVTCNEAFCMLPKKSVAFVAELTQDEKIHCEGVCVGCNSIHCINRIADDSPTRRFMERMTDFPLTYGYSRIFGRL